MKGSNQKVPVSSHHTPGKKGRYPVFDVSFETELKEHVLTLDKLYYGITKSELCKLAYELAEINKLPHPFNQEKKIAGNDWFHGFSARNPEVALRKPESTSLSRVFGFRKSEVQRLYDNLGAVFEKHHLEPHRIFNVDETGISTVQKLREKIVARKGEKQVGKIVSGEKGETITAVCCVSASGTYIPPMLIFPRKKFTEQLMRNSPPGCIGSCSPSGWINADLFLVWLKHFIHHTGANEHRKVLLVLDNHESHITLAAYKLCRENGVIMVSIPPHTSHRCQPLDLTIYGPLKIAYSKRCSEWLKNNPGKRITQYDVAELFGDAYTKTATVDKAVSGFRSAGIYPLNSATFTEENFAASANLLGLHSNVIAPIHAAPLTDVTTLHPCERPAPSTAVSVGQVTTQDPSGKSMQETASSEPFVRAPLGREGDIDLPTSVAIEITIETSVVGSEIGNCPVLSPLQNHLIYETETSHPKALSPSKANVKRVSVSTISPLPTPSVAKDKKRKVKCKRSEVLTASPMKEFLELKFEKRQSDLQKKSVKGKLNKKEMSESKASRMPKSKGKKMKSKADACPEYHCLICNELYTDPPIETWIQCSVCSGWCHEQCTGGYSSAGYVCDFCQ